MDIGVAGSPPGGKMVDFFHSTPSAGMTAAALDVRIQLLEQLKSAAPSDLLKVIKVLIEHPLACVRC